LHQIPSLQVYIHNTNFRTSAYIFIIFDTHMRTRAHTHTVYLDYVQTALQARSKSN